MNMDTSEVNLLGHCFTAVHENFTIQFIAQISASSSVVLFKVFLFDENRLLNSNCSLITFNIIVLRVPINCSCFRKILNKCFELNNCG